jgi:phenylpropionate dioxygenase-like ring-hydroxylating dioxygenase large terminal subunit
MSEISGLRGYWMPVLRADDVVADRPARAQLFGEGIVLWRSADGALNAAHDSCPHRSARLSNGWITDGALTCPYHAWQYGSNGRACVIPQLEPGLPIPPKAQLRIVNVHERYGLIWCALDTPLEPVPEFPEASLPGWRLIFEFYETWSGAAARIIDNAIDMAHVPVVHRATIGDFSKPAIERYAVRSTERGFVFNLTHAVADLPTQSRRVGDDTRRSEIEVAGPFAMIARIRYASGAVHALFTLACPLDDGNSLFIQFLARNDTEEEAGADGLIALDRRVTLEDKDIVEMTNPNVPLDLHDEVHLPADRSGIEYRRYLWSIHTGARHRRAFAADDVLTASGVA